MNKLNSSEILRAKIDKVQMLVIDDEPSVTDALKLILTDNGYEVAVASTGYVGLALARQRRFDVVISDVRLPDVTGLEVLAAVRQYWPGSVVILITAQCTTKLRADARARGAYDVLQKPFLPHDALRLISAALSKRSR